MRPQLVIRLSKVRGNIKRIRGQIGKDKKVIFVVKADCYGLSQELAKRLEGQVDSFAVSYPCEGVALREIGIKKDILTLLARDNEEIISALFMGFHISVDSLEMAERVNELSLAIGRKAIVHIKIDSGMNRFGIKSKEEFCEAEKLLTSGGHKIIGVFTHLVSDDTKFMKRQAEVFNSMTEGKKYFKHITYNKNIGGIIHDFDGVRSGIDILGGHGEGQCFHLFAKLIDIKKLKSFDLLGYNFGYMAMKEERVGIVSCGYADIAIKKLSNIGNVFVNGQKCDIIGNICMDVMFISMDKVKDGKIGDMVEIVGNADGIRVSDIASKMGTNEYEIMTSISKRVKRVYVK